MEYADVLWYGFIGVESELLETILCEDGKIIMGVTREQARFVLWKS